MGPKFSSLTMTIDPISAEMSDIKYMGPANH